MSNLLGDFFTGSTMLGGDPDEVTSGLHAHIVGKTRFVSPRLSLPAHLSGTIVGRTRFTATLGQRAPLAGTIVGSTILSGTLVVVERPQFTATIIGHTQLDARLSHEAQFDFQGSVGAAVSRSLLLHGQVLSGTGVVKPVPFQDEPQPVPYYV